MKTGDNIYTISHYFNYETSEFHIGVNTLEIIDIDKDPSTKNILSLIVRNVDTNSTWTFFYDSKGKKLEPYCYLKKAEAIKNAKELLKKEMHKHITNLNILREEYENLR